MHGARTDMTVSPKRRIWGWFFFDWASQPYSTLLLTFVFAPYFAEVARAHFLAQGLAPDAAGAAAQSYWGFGQTIAGITIALLAPILGAIADGSGHRMVWIRIFSVLYVLGAWSLWYLLPGASDLHWAMIGFALGLIGMEFATIFTNALMPSLGGEEELGKISGSGFAFGYLGGIIALVIMLLFLAENGTTGRTLIGIAPGFGLLDPAMREGTRSVGPFTAIWYAAFMVPFFLWVKEPRFTSTSLGLGASLSALGQLIRSLPRRKSLFAYLASSMFYRDALNALYTFGGVYASGVLGWSITRIGVFGIIGAVAAALATWAAGRIDSARGPKPVIVWSAVVLIAVCAVIVGMSRDSIFGIAFAPGSAMPDHIFYLCGALIGAAGGTIQSSSRTLMVFHATPDRATEAFGLYALSGKATAFIAPALITVATVASGSQRIGIAPLIGLFILALILLVWVKPKGERPA